MSSSVLYNNVFQAKIGNVQNQADSSGVYSAGVWSFKNSTALTSVTISDAGNVGIGTASPFSQAGFTILHVGSATTAGLIDLSQNGAQQFRLFCSGSDALIRNDATNGNITFTTKNSGGISGERMRIDASGNFLVGTTSATGRLTIQGTGGTTYSATISQDNSGGNVLGVFGPTNGTTQNFVVFAQAGNVKGTISTNGSTTSYNPSSDRRLKDNIQPLQNGLSSVLKLKPVTYNWKVTGDIDDGFIAQDLQEIPEFAHRVNPIGKAEDGSDLYGVDYMKFVSVLTAAIQELSAKNDALEARLAALEAKP